MLIVSNQLPVVLTKEDAAGRPVFEPDEDALIMQAKAGLRATDEAMKVYHVGCLPCHVPLEHQEEVAQQLMQDYNFHPVYLDLDLRDRFYKDFCKQKLWPLLHYLLPLAATSAARFQREGWQAYVKANKGFADKLTEIIHPDGDFIWIHDYHLMVLPSFLRKRFHRIRCGFFLHSPFPSSEIFRTFPKREEVLRSFLNADLIGFQSFDYARHFISCCSRMLGLEAQTHRGAIAIEYFGRKVDIQVLPTGVQPERLLLKLDAAEAAWRHGELAKQFEGQTVLLGHDDMDLFKGIELKLQAFEHVLEHHPEWRGRAVLIQVTNPARSASPAVADLRAEVKAIVDRVNGKFGSGGADGYRPIVWWERKVPAHEKVALYSLADCAVVTATRDGMNLMPYEYVVCRQGSQAKPGPRRSTLVVSEFVGCSPSLSCAIRVNPWNVEHVADGMIQCITMQEHEQQVCHEKFWRYVSTNTVHWWAKQYFGDLKALTLNHPAMRCYGLGLGLDTFRMIALDPNFRKLSVAEVAVEFSQAARRAIFLDFDGTLIPLSSIAAIPTPEVLGLLQALAAGARDEVAVVSGRAREKLRDFMAIPGLALSAEHGFFTRSGRGGDWEAQAEGDFKWKDAILPILEHYVKRTDGSYVEAKESELVWDYSNADPDLGSWQAKELLEHLDSVLANEAAHVVSGSGLVAVRPQGVGKHLAVRKFLAGGDWDLVVCIGEDASNEDMFTAVEEYQERQREAGAAVKTFACTVGQKPSKAPFYLDSPSEVVELLETLASG